MAAQGTTDGGSSTCAGETRRAVGKLAADPYNGISYHYGMLLGVTDFEAQQAYHRGKMRLHNAWLHRAGVVWGLAVQKATPDLWKDWSLKVTRGLALDAAGRELHVDAEACLRIEDWYVANQTAIAKLGDEVVRLGTNKDNTPNVTILDAHVVISFSPCPSREVPALVEPCDGAESSTAFSRIFEGARLELRAGKWKGQTLPHYPRLELLFRLRPPITQADVAEHQRHRTEFQSYKDRLAYLLAAVARDTQILEELEKLRHYPREEQPQKFRALFQRYAAEDELEIEPPQRTNDTTQLSLFPAFDEPMSTDATSSASTHALSSEVPLAAIKGILLTVTRDASSVLGARLDKIDAVDCTIRPVHLATATLQDLLNPFAPESVLVPPGPGPRVLCQSARIECREITFEVDRPLRSPSVTPAAFAVTHYADSCGWRKVPIEHARYRLCNGRHLVTLELCESPWHHDIERVRLIARGTGETPILGQDLAPLAGEVGGPPATIHDGIDFVHMFVRRADHARSEAL